jgi:Peptidase family M23
MTRTMTLSSCKSGNVCEAKARCRRAAKLAARMLVVFKVPAMRRNFLLMTAPVSALSMCAIPAADQFTPVLVSTLNPTSAAFLGTDGKQHVVYELQLVNANPTPATLRKIEVVEASDPTQVVAAYQGGELVSHLRTVGKTPVTSAEIEFGGARIFLLHLVFDQKAPIPRRLVHRITLLGGGAPAPTPQVPVSLHYTVAPMTVVMTVPVIGPPLEGKHWVAFNGCCEISGAHRASSQTVNGRLYFAQRFAIDWMRLDDRGRLLNGEQDDVRSYSDYGADVLAVADGKVVATLDTLEDQKPGTLPDPATITIENVDGNHVVLDFGSGVFGFYAHLQRGSINVSLGDHVKRGQVLGKLGNTGNTSAPHLHFHLMDGPSPLGSNGLPYVIDSFELAGEIPAARFNASEKLEGTWDEGMLPTPNPRHDQYPMDLDVINFPERR